MIFCGIERSNPSMFGVFGELDPTVGFTKSNKKFDFVGSVQISVSFLSQCLLILSFLRGVPIRPKAGWERPEGKSFQVK
jgi:hypothetical protein